MSPRVVISRALEVFRAGGKLTSNIFDGPHSDCPIHPSERSSLGADQPKLLMVFSSPSLAGTGKLEICKAFFIL
ncbi:hypothetical protein V1291_005312 [Nitrobacteraceae bacterium AZCC 1564]